MSINVVLVEPEIPQNTGNIIRTCAATGATLHLVRPLGFSLEDKYLKRSGLDYWDISDIRYYDSLEELFENPKKPEEIVKEKGWIQISDEGAIKEIVLKILENNPQSIAHYKAGKDRALGFLVGQAMKETKGKANPQMLNKLFLDELNK